MNYNPLHDEPSARTVKAVCKLGLFGLVVCALWAGLVRWWLS